MSKAARVFTEQIVDGGQWFERGMRAGYFPDLPEDPRARMLEPAALGPYEVLACERVETATGRWLNVTLRRFSHR